MEDKQAPAAQSTAKVESTTAPQIDPQKVAEAAATAAAEAAGKMAEKKAAEIASAKLKEAARVLTGEPSKSQADTLLENFAKDPAKLLGAVKEATKREIRQEQAQIEAIRSTQLSVGNKYIREYPEINTPARIAMVEKLAEQAERNGESYEAALDKGFKDAIKEFGLKSVSEHQALGTHVGLPGGGGMAPGAPKHDEQKSQSSFLEGMRTRMRSFRTRIPSAQS